jgi:hypothetical protein
MNIFVSWAGETSKPIAEALANFIHNLLQNANLFVSANADKGIDWRANLRKQLESTMMGIICLTPDNLTAPWLLFEAGAISKNTDDSRVWTYLHNLKPADVVSPLATFQHTLAEEQDTFKLVQSVRKQLEELKENVPTIDGLKDNFQHSWPRFKAILDASVPKTPEPPRRSAEEKIDELLEQTRALVSMQSYYLKKVQLNLECMRAAEERANDSITRANVMMTIREHDLLDPRLEETISATPSNISRLGSGLLRKRGTIVQPKPNVRRDDE